MNSSNSARRAALRSWGLYLLALTAWAAFICVCAFLGVIVCAAIEWQSGPLYYLLNFISNYLLLFIIACILAGWVVISWFFIGGTARDMQLMLDASELLAHPKDEPIRLPASLKSAEDKLNLAREQALSDARAAREAEQRKNDLVMYLAHDLKTPLTSVIGYLTLLRDEPELSPAMRSRYTGIALDKAERLEDLINEFFDITRFSLSHVELERHPVDLRRMLEQICSEFKPLLDERGQRCVLSLPDKLEVVCDRDKMARVFDNLLNNACRYGHPNSVISITAAPDEHSIVLRFRNSGDTIPEDKLSRMFEQFFRLDSSRGTKTGNAGLGLAIAKDIVEAHGGSISAASADGHVEFSVELPISQENHKNYSR